MKVILFQRPCRRYYGRGTLRVEVDGVLLDYSCQLSPAETEIEAAVDMATRRMWREVVDAIHQKLKDSLCA